MIWNPDDTQKVEYLEFSGNIDASFDQIDLARELANTMSGMPAILDSLSQPPPSGVSLRLQYLPFYAATSSLQSDLAEDLARALMAVGLDESIEWDHIFDILDRESQANAVQERAATTESGNDTEGGSGVGVPAGQ